VDDEVLGCFSFLNHQCVVVIAGVESRVGMPKSMRIDELDQSSAKLGFRYELLDHPVNNYQVSKLIAPFEDAIARYKPDTVLMPIPSYNQDHRAVYDAALVATRPHDNNWRVRRVFGFEQPHSQIWPYETWSKPSFHRVINVQDKLAAYQLYASQVRGHRSPETVAALAAIRGAEIGEKHAEAFHVLRWIDS